VLLSSPNGFDGELFFNLVGFSCHGSCEVSLVGKRCVEAGSLEDWVYFDVDLS